MNPMAVVSLSEQVKALKEIALHLHHAERGGLLFVSTPDAAADAAIAAELRLWVLDEVQVLDFTFHPEPVELLSLSHHLRGLPPPQEKSALFVFGLDELPPEARKTCINALNWGRERLAWAGYSVLLFVRPKTVGDLLFHAPDFFSWRSGVFEFDLPADPAERQKSIAHLRLFAPASLDHQRRRYSDYIRHTVQWLEFRGFLQVRNIVRLPLEDVFVPLWATDIAQPRLASDDPEQRGEGRRKATSELEELRLKTPRQRGRAELDRALQAHPRLVVLGDPGSGKSTLLKHLALQATKGGQSPGRQCLPILAPLAAYAEARSQQSSLSLNDFLPRHFSDQGLPDLMPLLTDALTRGYALVLLDGLDEVVRADARATVAAEVQQFAARFPRSRFVVTSRIAGYSPGALGEHFTPMVIAAFDEEDIERFARQWSRAYEAVVGMSPEAERRAELRANQLIAAIASAPPIQRLAANPLLLSLLALIHYQGTRLPQQRVELYRLCVEALAETWNRARSLTGRPIDLHLGDRPL
ncbi:MAG: NACHT domain-containing protein, partial [Planctomycetes bacterium]|nr:NACHT domain-containing protein [Planctomycetota bacterium]